MGYEVLNALNTDKGKITFCKLNVAYRDGMNNSFPSNTPFVEGGIYVNPLILNLNVGDEYVFNMNGGKLVFKLSGKYGDYYGVQFTFLNSSNQTVYYLSSDYQLNYNNNAYTKLYFAFLIDLENEKANFIRIEHYINQYSNVYAVYSASNSSIEAYNILTNNIPIEYNYKPIDYIRNSNKTLKLSMIKAVNTNHGESVTDGQTTDIQRFTDNTNMRVFCADMVENDVKVLGYTSSNNYVTVTKGYVDGNGAYTVTFKYYINGVHQSALDHTARVTSESIPSEPIWTPYYSLLLDMEHSACRPSRIYLNEQTNTVRYNDSENDQNVITDANQSLWFTWLSDGYHTDTTDPYDYGGNSTPDSGDGQWDKSSETIDIPTMPTVSISDTGFVSVFNPTLSQVKALADYMWAGAFDVSLFKKVMANPMDSIIGFALIPCEPTVSGVNTVKVGNIDTGVSMNAVSNQFVDVDCGTLDLNEYWGNYLDYAPYTKITLVLPFIGSVHLSPDDCMKKKIGIKYRIDILSGGCVAYVTCNGSVLYQFTGSCSAQLPITNLDYRGMISALISIGTTAVGVGSAIASGGITAPMVAVGVGNTANNVMNGKPNIQHGGSLGSTSGFLGTRIPYLIITRPRQCVPTGVNKFKGLPSLITSKLKNVTGFTQVHDIHLDDLPCSDAEKTELRSILESGVIV